MRSALGSIALLLAALAVPSAAHAGFFVSEALDGPSADIVRVDDLDLARDGTGAVAFVKRVGGIERVFVSRLVGGGFLLPEQVDAGLPGPSGAASVAASDGGRLAVTF